MHLFPRKLQPFLSLCLILDQILWHIYMPIQWKHMFLMHMYFFLFICQSCLKTCTCTYSHFLSSLWTHPFLFPWHKFITCFGFPFLSTLFHSLCCRISCCLLLPSVVSHCCHQSGHYIVYEDFSITISLISKCEPEFQVFGASKVHDLCVTRHLHTIFIRSDTFNSIYISPFRTIKTIW